MGKILWIDPYGGISGDRFAAALIGLGVPEREMVKVIKDVIVDHDLLDAHVHLDFFTEDVVVHHLHLVPLAEMRPTSWKEAAAALEKGLDGAGIEKPYADYARKAVSILQDSIHHSIVRPSSSTVSLPVIGTARTPYKHEAPYQPQAGNDEDGTFYIQVDQHLINGLHSLDSFSHIYVLSYLDRSIIPEVSVTPPWKDQNEQYGVFATRSPNRPSPIGLTRTRLHRVDGNRIYTGSLDLFDGTPILDIKPYIETLDGAVGDEPGNDGWLEGSDHLELHRLGIPHTHPGVSGSKDHSLITTALVMGIAWGLQYLDVESIVCKTPVGTGPDHLLEPETAFIFETYKIPRRTAAVSAGISDSAGAALLASLDPKFSTKDIPQHSERNSSGLGEMIFSELPESGALRLYLFDRPTKG